LPELLLGQPSSDKHEAAVALFIRFPRTLRTAFKKHVDALDHEALVVSIIARMPFIRRMSVPISWVTF
jgi:hypothetical protein